MREFLAFQELLVLSFFARLKNETKKGVLCRGVFLATRPKNRPSAPKFFLCFQKYFTVPMCYTYTRDKKNASRCSVIISKYFKEKKPDYRLLALDILQIKTINQKHPSVRASAGPSTTHNREPRTGSIQAKTYNSELTTDNQKQTTDNPKQQTPNKKPGTDKPQPKAPNSQLKTGKNKQQTTNHKNLRVLQLIDTLNPGGAERMAINLANSLQGEVERSFLCCTREEGLLKEKLTESVGYLFLKKKNSLDLQAFLKLKSFVKKEQIELVHAHGTSWFWGVLLKLSGLKIKLVWHDHYGESEHLEQRNIRLLKPLSRYFDGIISVNNDLKAWAVKRLKCRAVIQLNNFICTSNEGNSMKTLKGSSNDFKVLCVANFRPQKDHLNLLEAFEKLNIEGISLHLIGVDSDTAYSKKVREKISTSRKKIYYYGSLPEVSDLLSQADLGVLSSRSEGLPLALLEYGMAGLPVVCTNVGQCKNIIGDAALLIASEDPVALAAAIEKYYRDSKRRKQDALCLQADIKKAYSKEEVLPLFLEFYNNLRRR